ncbi:MAG: DUF4340 domain-containing protein [Clostridia bacterium]
MKNLKTIIIIVLALALAVAAYFIVKDIIAKTTTVNPNITEQISPSGSLSANVKRYTYCINGEVLTVELMDVKVTDENGVETTEQQFRLVNEPDTKLNDNIDTAIIQATSLVCVDVIEEDPADVSQYGIDYQSYFEIEMIDGTTYKVYFGDVIGVSYNVFCMREGVDKIYTISDTSFGMLTIYREYLLSEEIFPGNADSITSLSLYKNEELEFTIEPDEYVTWALTSPINAKTYTETAQDIVDNVYSLVVGDYVSVLPTQAEYKEYYLDDPAYSINVVAEGENVTINIGKESLENNSFYAKFDDKDEIFLVASEYLGWIDTELMEILYPIPYEPLVANVSSMLYKYGSGEVYSMLIEEETYLIDENESKNYKYTMNGDLLQIQYGSDLYLMTFYTSIIVEVDNDWKGPKEGEKPYLDIEVGYTSGNTEHISYYERDDETMYYIRYNSSYDMMTQYAGTIVDSAPIVESVRQMLGQYSEWLYVMCTNGADHEFGDWVVTKEPTEEEEGLKEKVCSICGHTIHAPIAKVVHTDPGSIVVTYWWIAVIAIIVVAGVVIFLVIRSRRKKIESVKTE